MSASARFGLGRSHSLKRARLVRALFDRSRSDVLSVSAGCVRFLYRSVSTTDLPGSLAVQSVFVVSRRVGGAVVRNRIRRLMKERFRQLRPALDTVLGTCGKRITLAIVYRGSGKTERRSVAEDLAVAMTMLVGRLSGIGPRQTP